MYSYFRDTTPNAWCKTTSRATLLLVARTQNIELPDGTTIPVLYEDRSVIAIDKPAGWMLIPYKWDKTDRNLHLAIDSSIRAGDYWARSSNSKYLRASHRPIAPNPSSSRVLRPSCCWRLALWEEGRCDCQSSDRWFGYTACPARCGAGLLRPIPEKECPHPGAGGTILCGLWICRATGLFRLK